MSRDPHSGGSRLEAVSMLRVEGRDGERNFRAVGQVHRHCASTVSPRDRVHDREPEADAATGTCNVWSTEALGRVRKEFGREPVAVIPHDEHELAVSGLCLEPYRTFSIPQGVVDEIPERLLESSAISREHLPLGSEDLELPTRRARPRIVAARHGVQQRAGVVPLDAQEEPAFISAGKHKQILG